MAFLTMSLYSNVLQMDTGVNVLLPEVRKGNQPYEPDKKYPVLYLLHGHGDDHTAWIRKSTIEYLTRNLDLIVVMPTVYRSYYTDGYQGLKCLSYLAEELPVKIGNFFPASRKREDTFVAGNSMGGYGAFRLALKYPDRYCAAASLSGALSPFGDPAGPEDDPFTLARGEEYLANRFRNFGDRDYFINSENNLCKLVDCLGSYGGKKPILYQCCGTEDIVTYEQNLIFNRYMLTHETGAEYSYCFAPGGHNWDFWSPQIPVFLKKFGLLR